MWSCLQNQALTGCTLLYVHHTLSNRWLFSGTLVLIPSRTRSEMYKNAVLSKKLVSPGILEVFMEYFFILTVRFHAKLYSSIHCCGSGSSRIGILFGGSGSVSNSAKCEANYTITFYPENLKILSEIL